MAACLLTKKRQGLDVMVTAPGTMPKSVIGCVGTSEYDGWLVWCNADHANTLACLTALPSWADVFRSRCLSVHVCMCFFIVGNTTCTHTHILFDPSFVVLCLHFGWVSFVIACSYMAWDYTGVSCMFG